MRVRYQACPAVLLLLLLPLSPARAIWELDGTVVCDASTSQSGTVAVADGQGGAFIVWTDVRNGTRDIFIQRMSPLGNAVWAPNGVVVCGAASDQDWPSLLPDGNGGVIVAWSDFRNGATTHYDIYAQRFNGSGVAQWAPNGVAVCAANRGQFYPKMTSNGAGGAIVAWDDDRANQGDVYAARLTSAGATPDGILGVAVSARATVESTPSLIPFGSGALIAWTDARNGVPDIFAARFSSAGTVLEPNGIPICATGGDQLYPLIAGDGTNGAIICWSDSRVETVYAQRLNSMGVVQWMPNGVPVGDGGTGAIFGGVNIVTDGGNGAIITWMDWDGQDYNIYAQRLNAAGARQWLPNDVEICNESSEQRIPVAASDLAGGAVIAWQDKRALGQGYDLYAQRVLSGGNVAWTPNGVPVCTAQFDQNDLSAVPDGTGGAIFAWTDRRLFTENDVYALRLDAGGNMPTTGIAGPGGAPGPAALMVLPAWPNPFAESTAIEVRLQEGTAVSVDVTDAAGRRVRRLGLAEPLTGLQRVTFDGRDDSGRALAKGVYFFRVVADGVTSTQKLVKVR